MYKKAKISIFCMIFVAGPVFCQDFNDKLTSDKALFNMDPAIETIRKINIYTYFHKLNDKKSGESKFKNRSFIKSYPLTYSVINADFYTNNFGFFCKQELLFEQATKIPLRFRLGSFQYNDYLEGKPNTGILSTY